MLAIRQAVPLKWGGRAEALNFLFAEFGGVMAGWPLILVLERLGGMHNFRRVLLVAAAAQSVCLLLAWLVGESSGNHGPEGLRLRLTALGRAISRPGCRAVLPAKPSRIVPVADGAKSHDA